MRSYDCGVVGAGVFGAWTAYMLRKAGRSVVLIDAYGPGNSRSSSGGESRIIRMSYGPDEIYTRWAARSLVLWKRLLTAIEAQRPLPAAPNKPRNSSQEPPAASPFCASSSVELGLFYSTGVLWTAPEGDPRVAGNRAALESCGVTFENLAHDEVIRRFPQIRFSWPIAAVFEPDSGVLLARRCVRAVVQEAVRLGVDYYPGVAERPNGNGRITRLTIGPGEELSCGEIVYACGPWMPKMFPQLLAKLIHVTRQEIFFFGTAPGDRRFVPPEMPVWLDYSDPRGGYSIPDLESRGFKLAFDRHGPAADPDTQERVVGTHSIESAREFLRERFPDLAAAPILETRVCQYENTSNGDFLIDRHPDFENVWLVGGGSGHGFKHGPAVGEYVEKLLAKTITPEPRFSLLGKTARRERAVF